MPSTGPFVVTLDAGSSSVRALLFDSQGRQQDGFGQQIRYSLTTTEGGGVEVDAGVLLDLSLRALTTVHDQAHAAGIKPAAVGLCTFWHGLVGMDRSGTPTTPLLHAFDTRSATQAAGLQRRLDARRVHARTGCVLHTSYWPAKLLWLAETRADAFRATDRWTSFGEYLFLKLFGTAAASTSMLSATGLWNQAANDYDAELLSALPVDLLHLCPWGEMDHTQSRLLPEYRSRLAGLDGIPWFPALGDGACDNVGSGCLSPDVYALMVGSSGALRVICDRLPAELPEGLFAYRLDRSRVVIGGALSNGGEVYDWMRRTLTLPAPEAIEQQLEAMPPGAHGLVLLPFFAGERSPYWRPDLRAAVSGLSLATRAIDLLKAGLESVALRFRDIYESMSGTLGPARALIGSGGALVRSPAWRQILADGIGQAITPCLEPESTSRGAALMALEHLGAIPDLGAVPPALGEVHQPRGQYAAVYQDLSERQQRLFQKIYSEN